MNKIKLSRGQKIKCKATQYQKYEYGIENISNNKQYEIIRGFGDKCLQLGHILDANEFNIVDDLGEPVWFTTTSIEDEPLFEVVEYCSQYLIGFRGKLTSSKQS